MPHPTYTPEQARADFILEQYRRQKAEQQATTVLLVVLTAAILLVSLTLVLP